MSVTQQLCPCGQPLHYSDPVAQGYVERLVDELGDQVSVMTTDGVYRVSRHYIALHGLKARDLEDLVRAGLVERAAE